MAQRLHEDLQTEHITTSSTKRKGTGLNVNERLDGSDDVPALYKRVSSVVLQLEPVCENKYVKSAIAKIANLHSEQKCL